ncbi:MAG: LacI family transcriptional regulator [Marinilabiliales bacterium]|nr:LacI family transcriptional regulator [Marinilabiliales bacterium]
MKRSIRIKDIASKAGVSIGTVDRVLHNRGEVSEETRQKIQQIIEELDYRPNLLASSLASKKGIHFATLIPKAQGQDSYWSKPLTGIEKASHQLRTYGVKVSQFFFEMEDSSSFVTESARVLESKPDGVVLAPWVKREALTFTRQLDELQIPYVFIDSTLSEAHPASFVAQSSFDSGYLAAKLLDWGLPEEANVLLVHIARELDNANHLLQREKGFMQYFNGKEQGKRRILKMEVAGNGEGDVEAHLQLLGLSPCGVNGVFVTNSKVHLAAGCFKSLCAEPKIVGYDLIPSNVSMLKEGIIDFLICQKPELQGFKAVLLLFDLLVKKERISESHFTSIDLITAENIAFYSAF